MTNAAFHWAQKLVITIFLVRFSIPFHISWKWYILLGNSYNFSNTEFPISEENGGLYE